MSQLGAFVMIIIAATATPAKPAGERLPGWLGMGYVWSTNTTGPKTLVVQRRPSSYKSTPLRLKPAATF